MNSIQTIVDRHAVSEDTITSMANEFVCVGSYEHSDFPVTPLTRVIVERDTMIFNYAVDQARDGRVRFYNECSEINHYMNMYANRGKDKVAAQKALNQAVAFKIPDVTISEDDSYMKFLRYLDYVFIESLRGKDVPVVVVDPESSILAKLDKANISYEIVFCLQSSKYNKKNLAKVPQYSKSIVFEPSEIDDFYAEYKHSDSVMYFGISGPLYDLERFKRAYAYCLYPYHPMVSHHGISDFIDGKYYDNRLARLVKYDNYKYLPQYDLDDLPTYVPSKYNYGRDHAKYVGLYRVYQTNIDWEFARETNESKNIPDIMVSSSNQVVEEKNILVIIPTSFGEPKTKKVVAKLLFSGDIYDIAYPATFNEKISILQASGYVSSWHSLSSASNKSSYLRAVSPHYNKIFKLRATTYSAEPQHGAHGTFTKILRPSESQFGPEMKVHESPSVLVKHRHAKYPNYGYWEKTEYLKDKTPRTLKYELFKPDPDGEYVFMYSRLKGLYTQDTGWSLVSPVGHPYSHLFRHVTWYYKDSCTDMGNWNVDYHDVAFQRYSKEMEWGEPVVDDC